VTIHESREPDVSRRSSRADAARRRRERRRRQTRRFLPILIVVLVAGVALALFSRHGSPSAAPTTTAAPVTTTTVPYNPPAVAPVFSKAEAGEGVWSVKDSWMPGAPGVESTWFRSTTSNPSVIAYAFWMRAAATQMALYLGYEGPGPTSLDRGPEMVPLAARSTLLSTFNSGFYEKDGSAGFYTHRTLFFPMVKGLGTVVEYANGSYDVMAWQGGPTPGSSVAMARQNLPLIVDNGHATTPTANWANYGITLGGVPAVPRTALGIDTHGNLIYATATSQLPSTLAQIMIHLGCIRAMQLDINPAWPIYNTYGGPGAVSPSLNVPNSQQIAGRFLYNSTKDFFALYARVPGQAQIPW